MSTESSAYYSFRLRYGSQPADWEEIRIRDAVDIVGGGTPDSTQSTFWDGKIPWLTPTEMTLLRGRLATTSIRKITELAVANSNCRLLPVGSLVLSTRGTIGLVAVAGVPLTCNQSCEALLPKGDNNADYLYYLLRLIRPILERFGAGTTFTSITRRDFRDIRIALPKPLEQDTIAKVLIAVDDVLSGAETRLTVALRVKIALMQQVFASGAPGHHTQFKDTKIGTVPEAWDIVPLGIVATIVSGIALNPEREARFHPRQYLTVINVQRERLELTEVRYMEVFPEEIPTALLQDDDIVLVEGHANSSEIGRAALITESAAGFAYQNHLFRIRLRPEARMVRPFLLAVLNSERVRRHWVATCNTSSGLNTINSRGVRRLLIPLPQLNEQQEIADLLAASNNNIAACEAERQAVDHLKRSLLQNLLTGKVRVRV